jgi:hypothetical protein
MRKVSDNKGGDKCREPWPVDPSSADPRASLEVNPPPRRELQRTPALGRKPARND